MDKENIKTAPVMPEKVLRCLACGEEFEDNSLDTQLRHWAETGHRLYTEVFVFVR